GGVAVGEHDAFVAAENCASCVRAATVFKAVVDCIGTADGPDLPALPFAAILLSLLTHQLPVRLIDANDRLHQDMLSQTLVGGSKAAGEGIDLIPERLRIDQKTITLHASHLALQRQMVGVLCHRYMHCKAH